MTMATTTVIAQYFGAKRPDKVKQAISNSITVNVIMGLAFGLIGLAFRYPLLRLVGTRDDVITFSITVHGNCRNRPDSNLHIQRSQFDT